MKFNNNNDKPVLKSQMEACAQSLLEVMKTNPRVIVMTADLVGSCSLREIEKTFPGRLINVGVAEQNMVSIAAGLAHEGWIPFVYSFSVFTSLRACEQVRTDLFYNCMNVKVIGTHSGISTGQAGPTHFSLEDIGVIRSMPESRIVVPSDAYAAKRIVNEMVEYVGPVYLRLDRNPLPVIYNEGDKLRIGSGKLLCSGGDVLIVAVGSMVSVALEAARIIEMKSSKKVSVIDMHTIKPIDHELLTRCAEGCSNIITIEEHNIFGGLGSAVAEVVAEAGMGIKLTRFGIRDTYPQGAPVHKNLDGLGLCPEKMSDAIMRLLI
ncbi:MAG TPA: transketolase C-terminal domain-containing protein [Clostridia bacterium]